MIKRKRVIVYFRRERYVLTHTIVLNASDSALRSFQHGIDGTANKYLFDMLLFCGY